MGDSFCHPQMALLPPQLRIALEWGTSPCFRNRAVTFLVQAAARALTEYPAARVPNGRGPAGRQPQLWAQRAITERRGQARSPARGIEMPSRKASRAGGGAMSRALWERCARWAST